MPMGHIPRSLTAMVKGELVRLVSPGDIIEMTGIFLPKPATNGFRVRARRPSALTGLTQPAVEEQRACGKHLPGGDAHQAAQEKV